MIVKCILGMRKEELEYEDQLPTMGEDVMGCRVLRCVFKKRNLEMNDEDKKPKKKQCKKKIEVFFKKRISVKTIVIVILALVMIVLVPIGINKAYKVNGGYTTCWTAADVLTYYGACLSFIGATILGCITVYQNKKMHKLNEQMQRMQHAQFVSMVQVDERKSIIVHQETKDSLRGITKFNNAGPSELINMTKETYNSSTYYCIDIKAENKSEYPIVQLDVHVGERDRLTYKLFEMEDQKEQPIYIGSEGYSIIRIIIPRDPLQKRKMKSLKLSVDFVNVFNVKTSSSIYIEDLEPAMGNVKFKFRILKITDVL